MNSKSAQPRCIPNCSSLSTIRTIRLKGPVRGSPAAASEPVDAPRPATERRFRSIPLDHQPPDLRVHHLRFRLRRAPPNGQTALLEDCRVPPEPCASSSSLGSAALCAASRSVALCGPPIAPATPPRPSRRDPPSLRHRHSATCAVKLALTQWPKTPRSPRFGELKQY